MEEKQDVIKESASIIEEIESQLAQILAKKREEVDRELEERIKREEQEAKRKLEEIEQQIGKERETLSRYRTVISESESGREEIKNRIKERLSRASELQSRITALAEETLRELSTVALLNSELEKLQREAAIKAEDLKKVLEERYGIHAGASETLEKEGKSAVERGEEPPRVVELIEKEKPAGEVGGDELGEVAEAVEKEKEETSKLENELAKLKKIKELLGEIESQENLNQNFNSDLKVGHQFEPEAGQEEEKTAGPQEMRLREAREEDLRSLPFAARERLEKYRKTSEDVSYFEHEGRIILDAETVIAGLEKSLAEARKLYIKLSETESPKEQFFVKQEIIWHQEVLRELLLSCLRMCERQNCSLAKYTEQVLNMDILKTFLQRVSSENWSNKEYFTSFDGYAKDLGNAFYARITPPDMYWTSISRELKID